MEIYTDHSGCFDMYWKCVQIF